MASQPSATLPNDHWVHPDDNGHPPGRLRPGERTRGADGASIDGLIANTVRGDTGQAVAATAGCLIDSRAGS